MAEKATTDDATASGVSKSRRAKTRNIRSQGGYAALGSVAAAPLERDPILTPDHKLSEPIPIDFVYPGIRAMRKRKRLFDLVFASAFAVVSLPLWLAVALAVKVTSPGPLFFRSRRVGLSGQPFDMLKFRSMYIDAEKRQAELMAKNDNDGPCFKMKHDPRITPVGRFIRRLSLDELPQFLNVLRGEMSLVGPRALHEYEIEKMDDYARERLALKPGITCYWQVMGRSNLTFEQWVALDHKYLEDISTLTDLRILLKTPLAVLRGDGAY